jgi:hypothetical protein
MKQVFSSQEAPHIWAKQSQTEGRNSARNVFFEGSRIYSYGRHFCMADIIKPGIVLINDSGYSVTTAKQLRWVSYAVNHMERIFVPDPESLSTCVRDWTYRINQQLGIIGHPRKRPQTKDNARAAISGIIETINRYVEVTQKELPGDFKELILLASNEQASKELAAKIGNENAQREKEQRERQKELNAEREREKSENFERWKQGYNIYYHDFREFPVALRVKDSNVETSFGAKVTYESAKLLYSLIVAGKDIKGHNIDGYTVISLNGVLTIGCHKIERSEIERFAQTQNW